MADDFKAGDIVELKSGGPTMTIESIDVEHMGGTTQGVYCSWFDEKNKPQRKWFPLTSLEKALQTILLDQGRSPHH